MKLDLEELIEAIADRVVAKIAEAGGTVSAGTAPAKDDKAAGKTATAPKTTTKPKGKPKDAGPDRPAVYEKVKALSDRDGKPAAREIINEFAATFGEVSDDDLGALLAKIEEALAAEKDDDL